jgi:hypothetical protein
MQLDLDAKTAAFWQAYLTSLPHAEDASRRFYEIFQIGNSPEAADEGAALIRPRSWHRLLCSISLQKTQRLDLTKG